VEPVIEMLPWVGLLTLFGILAEALRKFLDIHVPIWSLRLQGARPKAIHKIALANARRKRQSIIVQILKLLLQFVRS
jgi:hypothetical protein